MIFVTVGTHEPFDRLVQEVAEWSESRDSKHPILAQITERAIYKPTSFEWVASMDPDEFMKRCEEAELIVSHAGMGSIITAMSLRKTLVIMPRRGHLAETRNDHQRATAERFGSRRGIHVADDANGLRALLDSFLAGRLTEPGWSINPVAEDPLINAIREFIHEPGAR